MIDFMPLIYIYFFFNKNLFHFRIDFVVPSESRIEAENKVWINAESDQE